MLAKRLLLALQKAGRWIDKTLAPDVCPLCREALAIPGYGCCADCQAALPFPRRRCTLCGGQNDGYLDVCRNCMKEGARSWFHGVTAFNYEGCIQEAVWNFKYRGQLYLGRFFARQMANAWREHNEYAEPDAIMPVPLHWRRRLSRGYNQTKILAGLLADILGIPVLDGMRRIRPTGHQAAYDSRQRHVNLRGAFSVKCPDDVRGRDILLLDDVLTTGCTLNEAATVLKAAGAADVSVITIARDL